jgi:malic enzyme
MREFCVVRTEAGREVCEVYASAHEMLNCPLLNKGTAFTAEERRRFQLWGMLPPHISTLEEQIARSYENYSRKESPLEKHIFLRALQDRNETLFYALFMRYMEEMTPIVYTPTVGQACKEFSHIYRRPRGLFITLENIDYIDKILRNWPQPDIDIIVATDSEAILGIGDQGIGGMGIPIGKLSLYTAAAGIHPGRTLPVTLDVGTNNEALLKDPLYLGLRRERLRGEPYLEFMDKFVAGIKKRWPKAILQWEDLSKQTAFTVLHRYRETIQSFNDDIQGTGAMVLAGILAALTITGQKFTDLRFVVHGAGASGIGISTQLFTALRQAGLNEAEAKGRFCTLDSQGVVFSDRPGLEPYKKAFALDPQVRASWGFAKDQKIGLLDAVKHHRCSVLIGTSGHRGEFTEPVIAEMLNHTERPIVFALSNPTTNTEADPADVYRWSQGRAIVATGSPFPDVSYNGKTFKVGQANNAFMFPGIGLGALVSGARIITDEMLTAGAMALRGYINDDLLRLNCLYPPVSSLRDVSRLVAIAVAEEAYRNGVATTRRPKDLAKAVSDRMWWPVYLPYVPGKRKR